MEILDKSLSLSLTQKYSLYSLNSAKPDGSSVKMVDSQREKPQAEDNRNIDRYTPPLTGMTKKPLQLSPGMIDFRFKDLPTFARLRARSIALWVCRGPWGK